MTFDQIADFVRKTYPTAVAVTFHVTSDEMEMKVQTRQETDGFTMRQLNGEWVPKKTSVDRDSETKT